MFGIAALLAVCAIALHFSNWRRGARFDLPMTINMVGLFVLMITGTFDPPPGRLRRVLTIVALALIFPTAFWVFLH